MTKIISLHGGPGTGKSTTAAKTFALLKEQQENAELVSEYVKQWAWEKRVPVNYDQFYFFGKQTRKEYSLFGKVDYIVTDSPIVMSGMYAQMYGTPHQAVLFRSMVLTYLDMVKASGHEHIHVFLNRVKKYNPAGRYQTEDQAKDIDLKVRQYLTELGIDCVEVAGDENAHDRIVDIVKFSNSEVS